MKLYNVTVIPNVVFGCELPLNAIAVYCYLVSALESPYRTNIPELDLCISPKKYQKALRSLEIKGLIYRDGEDITITDEPFKF